MSAPRKPSAALAVPCTRCGAAIGHRCLGWDSDTQKHYTRARSCMGRLVKAKRATPAGREAARHGAR